MWIRYVRTHSNSFRHGILFVVSGVLQFLLCFSFVVLIPGIQAVPYNLREIISTDSPEVTAFSFSLVCYLTFGVPVLFGRWLASIKTWRSRLIWLISTGIPAIITFFLLKASVPMESLHDIVGAPVFKWPGPWEMLYRFSGVFLWIFGGFAFSGTLAMLLVGKKGPSRSGGKALLFSLPLFLLIFFFSYDIVVAHACTDNLVELMARGGDVQSFVMLTLFIVGLGFLPSLLALQLLRSEVPGRMIITAISAVIAIPICYGLLSLGTASTLTKYGKTFSALQFFFSPDRSLYLGGIEVLLRYSIANFIFITVTVVNQIPCLAILAFLNSGKNKRFRFWAE